MDCYSVSALPRFLGTRKGCRNLCRCRVSIKGYNSLQKLTWLLAQWRKRRRELSQDMVNPIEKSRIRYFTEGGMEVPAVTADEMREIDRVAMEDTGPNLLQMMENAGRSLALLAIDPEQSAEPDESASRPPNLYGQHRSDIAQRQLESSQTADRQQQNATVLCIPRAPTLTAWPNPWAVRVHSGTGDVRRVPDLLRQHSAARGSTSFSDIVYIEKSNRCRITPQNVFIYRAASLEAVFSFTIFLILHLQRNDYRSNESSN